MSAPTPTSLLTLEPRGLGPQAIKWGAGFGMSLLILFILAQVQRTKVEQPPPPIADLQTVALDETPPPPPEIASREPPPPTVLDLEPLPSDNPVKIRVAALTYEVPLPEATPMLEFNLADFRPDLDGTDADPNHIFQFSEVDQRPVIIHRVKPDVPGKLLAVIKNPRVVVSMVVSRGGDCRNITLVTSSGHKEIDRIVIDALAQWRFRPAMRDGAPVNCMVIQSIIIKAPRSANPFSVL